MHWSFEKASVLVWLEGMLEGLEQPEATYGRSGWESFKIGMHLNCAIL